MRVRCFIWVGAHLIETKKTPPIAAALEKGSPNATKSETKRKNKVGGCGFIGCIVPRFDSLLLSYGVTKRERKQPATSDTRKQKQIAVMCWGIFILR